MTNGCRSHRTRTRLLLLAIFLVPASWLVAACGSRLTGPTPTVMSVSPASGPISLANPIVIHGRGFSPTPQGAAGSVSIALPRVFLLGGTAGSASTQELTPVTFFSSTALGATIPAGISPGSYGIKVVNPDGKSGQLLGAYTAFVPSSLSISTMFPRFGWTSAATPVEITGAGFHSTPTAELLSNPPTPLVHLAFLSSNSLSAVVPAGIPVGTYALQITDPLGAIGVLNSAFTVTAQPPPRIDDVSPSANDNAAARTVTVTGANFPTDCVVALLGSAGTATATTVNSVTGGTSMSVTIPSTVAIGNYLVRATRPADGAYGDFAVYTVTGPSGNPGPWGPEASMPDARRRLGLAVEKDDLGNPYLYAVGGEQTDNAGTVLQVYDTVDFAPLDRLGHPRNWGVAGAHMTKRRDAVSVWSHKGYVYAAGGIDETGAVLSSVERAKVLRAAGEPTALAAAAQATGSLANGTWYYRVSAIVSDADNPGGETLASDFAVITLAGGGVSLTWSAPAEGTPTSYRVYRTPTVNGALGEERLLATNVMTTSFVDDGTLTTDSSQAPQRAGSLGTWVTLPALPAARAAAGTTIARAPLPGATAYGGEFVYLVGGVASSSATAAGLADYAYVMLSTTGGDLASAWATGTGPSVGREEAAVCVADMLSAPTHVTTPKTFVYVEGGQDASQANPNNKYPTSIEVGSVASNGRLSFQTIVTSSPKSAAPVGLFVDNYLWSIGGDSNAGVSSAVFTGQMSASPPELVNMNSTGHALPNPPGGRAQAGGVLFKGFIYVVGGTTNMNDSLPDVTTAVF